MDSQGIPGIRQVHQVVNRLLELFDRSVRENRAYLTPQEAESLDGLVQQLLPFDHSTSFRRRAKGRNPTLGRWCAKKTQEDPAVGTSARCVLYI